MNSQPLNEQTAREYLQLIAQENLRLSRLIDNFLTFSRMERNKYAFGFKEVPATEIVEGAVAAVRERFNAPGCQFETQIAPDLPCVVADADAMVTALVNLLDNAYKYSGDEKQITLSAGAENGSVCFAVKDNGIGLSPRDTKRIFKRFFQVDQRLSRSGGGCGLGLSIVKFIVTAHHGSVRVESQPGRGSTFIISLPASGHGAADDSSRETTARMSCQPMKSDPAVSFTLLARFLAGETVLYSQPWLWAVSAKSLPSYRISVGIPLLQEISLCVTDQRVLLSRWICSNCCQVDWAAWLAVEDAAADQDRITEVVRRPEWRRVRPVFASP